MPRSHEIYGRKFFKNFLIKKLNEYMLEDFNYIYSLNLNIIYKNSWEFTLEELLDFLVYLMEKNVRYIEEDNFVDYIFEKLLQHFIVYREKNIIYDVQDIPDYSMSLKRKISVEILELIYEIKLAKKSLSDDEKIEYICESVYNKYDGGRIYDNLIKSKNIFFAHYENHSEIIIESADFSRDYHREFLLCSKNIEYYYYDEYFPQYFSNILQKIKKICSEIIHNDKFIIKSMIPLKYTTHIEFCKKFHIDFPIDILANKLFIVRSIKKNLPYYNKDSDVIYILKNEDIIQDTTIDKPILNFTNIY